MKDLGWVTNDIKHKNSMRPSSSWTNRTNIAKSKTDIVRQIDRRIDRRASISKGALRGHKMSLRISQSPFLRGSDNADWVGRTGGRAGWQLHPPLAGSIPQVSMVSAESIISHTMACNYKGQLCATAAGCGWSFGDTALLPVSPSLFSCYDR